MTTEEVEKARSEFELRVYAQRYLASIKRNPASPQPKICDALDFVSIDCPTREQFLARDEKGNYIDKSVSAMWFGWCLALGFLQK